jgi:predicted Zn-dependent protease
MEQLARAETRRQIRASAGRTYLNEIVAASPDSMLHRWGDRSVRPIRVYVPARSRVANYQPAFADAVRAAFREWEGVGLPVRFDVYADSVEAEVRVRWRVQFDEVRTGQTDIEWGGDGYVLSADVTIATFDTEGQAMPPEGVRIVALHEVGHVLGLDHSPDPADLMHPVARVPRLSLRDTETAQLLYQLTPGTLR